MNLFFNYFLRTGYFIFAIFFVAACSDKKNESNDTAQVGSTANDNSGKTKSQAGEVEVQNITGGLTHPWALAFLPDGSLLVTEIGGKLYKISKEGKKQEIKGVPKVLAKGQGGLLDVILHPDFANNQLIYLTYSAVKEEQGKTLSTTAVMRAKLEGNSLSQQKKIFEAMPYGDTQYHYGSRMAFGEDGYLYFSVGDRGKHDENPQQLDRDAGKIHRIKDDGSIPADNPFVAQGQAQASVYSYGHRNPQGLTFHPQNGQLWSNEHGPRGGDEINIIQKAANYGWPVISYGINYDGTILTNKTEAEEMQWPLLQWTPSIAPSGMAFVTGNRYKGWEGSLLSGSLRYKYLNRTVLQGDKVVEEEQLIKNVGRLRNVKMAPDGYIYIGVEDPARIYRLMPITR
ncbi:MAG: PQQ-dependent sugar dehydrogenase [Bacteroidetes bacterium]|nr:PQQ-dependent sugar dehydrogenase [Bacteroidota bacterium]